MSAAADPVKFSTSFIGPLRPLIAEYNTYFVLWRMEPFGSPHFLIQSQSAVKHETHVQEMHPLVVSECLLLLMSGEYDIATGH